ncbi:hypothetical protein [Mycoplasma leonicaptivi]|uniref:hypothetical protein n=1 Tax=Mycoplasma leonicaptivi TaxID=36742 RepID=UPI00048382DC|nr:hypothetical protein [Mycoplasma leonicaptivi]
MKEILKKLEKKLKKDKKQLRILTILDSFFSFLITIMNLASVGLAIAALFILIQLGKKDPSTFGKSSFIFLLVLVVLILLSFILTIGLSIYKHNNKTVQHNRLLNTLNYVKIKYEAKLLSEQDIETIIDKIWTEASSRTKIEINKIIKNEFKSGKVIKNG